MNNVWDWKEIKRDLKQPWKIPRSILENIRYSWQRIVKGYCDKDLWNIDYWFMRVVPDMLQQFKDTKHGSPGILGEDYVDEDGILCNDTCHEAWDKILEEMIFLFREMNEETCQKKNVFEKEHKRIYDEQHMRAVVRDWKPKNRITTPLAGTPSYVNSGIIKAVMKSGEKISVAQIDYQEFDEENFQYVICPYWEIIDGLPACVSKEYRELIWIFDWRDIIG